MVLMSVALVFKLFCIPRIYDVRNFGYRWPWPSNPELFLNVANQLIQYSFRLISAQRQLQWTTKENCFVHKPSECVTTFDYKKEKKNQFIFVDSRPSKIIRLSPIQTRNFLCVPSSMLYSLYIRFATFHIEQPSFVNKHVRPPSKHLC